MDNKRDNKGRFPPGVSGNPSGRKKNGDFPVQPSPVADMKALVSLAHTSEEMRATMGPIFGQMITALMPTILKLAVKRMHTDNRILALMMQTAFELMNKSIADERNSLKQGTDPDQLRLDFEELASNAGVNNIAKEMGIDLPEINTLNLREAMDKILAATESDDANRFIGLDAPAETEGNGRKNQDQKKEDGENGRT